MDAKAAVQTRSGARRPVGIAVITVLAVFSLGMTFVGMVNALESNGCGPYGYGGGYCGPARINVQPADNLVDAQTVTVTGQRFARNKSFGAAQCDPSTPTIDGCDLSHTVITTTDSVGTVSFQMTVRRIITVQGKRIDCAKQRCIIGAGTLRGGTPIETDGALTRFDPNVPPLPRLTVTVTVTTVTPKGMSGTVTCSRSNALADVSGGAAQRTPASGNGYTRQSVACGPTPSEWELGFSSRRGTLVPGPAVYSAYASASDPLDYAYTSASGQTTIVRSATG